MKKSRNCAMTDKTIQILVYTAKQEIQKMRVQGVNPVERAVKLMAEMRIEQFKIIEQ